MLIPYNTDAPIYHWPYATLGTIIVNALVFVGVAIAPEERQDWIYEHFILVYGEWNPIQWLTSNYLHAGFLHVLGNMVVLWGIGIIIEGKVGWWPFLLIYNGIGIFQCGIEQTLMLFAQTGGSLGASAIIYGLIAIAMLWAPRNDLNCFLLAGYWSTTFDLPVLTYAGFSFAVEFVLGVINVAIMSQEGLGLALTSQILHLMGAATGFAVGAVMLKRGWVDCENWDLFSVLTDRHRMTREERALEALTSKEGQAKLAAHADTLRVQLRNFLAAGEAGAALTVHRRGKIQFGSQWQISDDEYVQIISGLRKAHQWDDAVQVMAEFLRTPTERAPLLVRLALAQILVEQLSRPGQALKVLAKLDARKLSTAQQATFSRLRERAQAAAADDPYEIAADDW